MSAAFVPTGDASAIAALVSEISCGAQQTPVERLDFEFVDHCLCYIKWKVAGLSFCSRMFVCLITVPFINFPAFRVFNLWIFVMNINCKVGFTTGPGSGR